jgi:hypothetical protein
MMRRPADLARGIPGYADGGPFEIRPAENERGEIRDRKMEKIAPNYALDYARQLFDAHGAKAIVEAAQRAAALERKGEKEEAKIWRRIEAALKEMAGPHQP